MARNEWRKQADAFHEQILQLLKLHETAFIGQDSYKSDFFEVFAEAYHSRFCVPGYRIDKVERRFVRCKAQRPLISGDTIWTYAKNQGWVHAEMTGNEKRYRDIELIRTWWDEWVYAWTHYSPRRRDVRREPTGDAESIAVS